MIVFKTIKSNDINYPFVENLLHSAFPENERRDNPEQRLNTDEHPLFHCDLICTEDNNEPIGLITYWDFDRYLYIEHLAIDPQQRSKGYGRVVLGKFITHHNLPIVLEVEHPNDEQSRRRISFYENCNLKLWQCDYLQPPYRKDDDFLPLYLMVTDGLDLEQDYEEIRNKLYSEVYNIED